jgi:hypothetical protein
MIVCFRVEKRRSHNRRNATKQFTTQIMASSGANRITIQIAWPSARPTSPATTGRQSGDAKYRKSAIAMRLQMIHNAIFFHAHATTGVPATVSVDDTGDLMLSNESVQRRRSRPLERRVRHCAHGLPPCTKHKPSEKMRTLLSHRSIRPPR